jgi:putative peptidoglycan lipid II flippase
VTAGAPGSRLGAGLVGSAALVAGLTLAARLAGFGRVFAFSASVGAGCTGTAYAAANQLPNVLFEVVAGGALAGAVVPAVASALARGGSREADEVSSALLTWTVLVLLPVALLLALFAAPITGLLLGGSTGTTGATGSGAGCPDGAALAARMLVVFAPQVLLYGVGIVLAGVLQARHRFAGPALAPLLSSVVVIAAYLGYAALAGPGHGEVTFVPGRAAELVLAGGTTAGVVALSLPLLVPARRVGVRLRATLRFPAGAAAPVRALALAGVTALVAQQAAVVAVLALATRRGGTGALNAYQYAQTVYLLPYAVLAVPVATAAFPRLARQAADGDTAGFASTAARTTRGVLAASAVGAGALAAAAPAVQRLFERLDAVGGPALAGLAGAVTALAPGLLGWALVAHLGRALNALHRGRAAAAATVAGWLAVVVASLALVAVRDGGPGPTVLGLAAGNSVGMGVAGLLLLVALRRAAGGAAVRGVPGTLGRAAGAAVAAAVAGRLAADAVLRVVAGVPGALLAGLAGGTVVLVVAGALLGAAERETLEPVLSRLRPGSRGRGRRGHDRTEMHDHREGGARTDMSDHGEGGGEDERA